jgi:RNA polymerase sigma-70 factor (ECF subfamily)
MNQVRAGCPEALNEVCVRYGEVIRRVVRRKLSQRLRARYDSVDFIQEVLASFVRQPHERCTFASPDELTGYLARMARNKVYDAYRRDIGAGKRNMTREEPFAHGPEAAPAPHQPTPSQVAIADERWDRLLDGLSSVDREVVRLLREGHTHDETARRLGLHTKNVQRLVRRLHERLKP